MLENWRKLWQFHWSIKFCWPDQRPKQHFFKKREVFQHLQRTRSVRRRATLRLPSPQTPPRTRWRCPPGRSRSPCRRHRRGRGQRRCPCSRSSYTPRGSWRRRLKAWWEITPWALLRFGGKPASVAITTTSLRPEDEMRCWRSKVKQQNSSPDKTTSVVPEGLSTGFNVFKSQLFTLKVVLLHEKYHQLIYYCKFSELI